MKQQVINYWQSLKEQEQKLLMVAGVVFVIFVLVMGIFRPLSAAVADAQARVEKNHELVSWVNSSVARLKSGQTSQATSVAGNISQLVNQTRGRYQINISKMQPNDNALRLTIDSVEFNKLISWLDELTNQYGVKVENLDMTEGDLPGFVRVSRLVVEL
ncbi:type II secretion system protein GspM [Pseudoalteromonas sp. T1lg65]|uniref:type II secretion system protein GspM n=1 Tax=Pseudoalteromonas sp. T1lg65 TaxID=2077101 RepID=UPI003F7B1A6C